MWGTVHTRWCNIVRPAKCSSDTLQNLFGNRNDNEAMECGSTRQVVWMYPPTWDDLGPPEPYVYSLYPMLTFRSSCISLVPRVKFSSLEWWSQKKKKTIAVLTQKSNQRLHTLARTCFVWCLWTEQAKSKDDVIRRNLDRIRVSAATSPPSNPSWCSQVSFIKNK